MDVDVDVSVRPDVPLLPAPRSIQSQTRLKCNRPRGEIARERWLAREQRRVWMRYVLELRVLMILAWPSPSLREVIRCNEERVQLLIHNGCKDQYIEYYREIELPLSWFEASDRVLEEAIETAIRQANWRMWEASAKAVQEYRVWVAQGRPGEFGAPRTARMERILAEIQRRRGIEKARELEIRVIGGRQWDELVMYNE